MKIKEIKVIVSGGLVQDIQDIPEGIRVKVLDYDSDGIDESHPCTKKIDGEWAFVGVWEAS